MGGETGMGRRRTGRGSTSTPRDVPSKFCAYSVHDHDDKVNTQIDSGHGKGTGVKEQARQKQKGSQ